MVSVKAKTTSPGFHSNVKKRGDTTGLPEVIMKLINEPWRKECVLFKASLCQPCDTFNIQQFQTSGTHWLKSRLRDVWFDSSCTPFVFVFNL